MNRLIRIRLIVALAILTTVSALAVSATRPVTTSLAANASAPTAAAESIPMLPTITVVAEVDHPALLPVVIVRPSDAERQASLALEVAATAVASGGGAGDFVSDLLPRARLDMPYYSFGKMIPGASKD